MFSWRTSIKLSELSDILNSDDFQILFRVAKTAPGKKYLAYQDLNKCIPSITTRSVLEKCSFTESEFCSSIFNSMNKNMNYFHNECISILEVLNIPGYTCFTCLLLNLCYEETNKTLIINLKFNQCLSCGLRVALSNLRGSSCLTLINLIRKVLFMKNLRSCSIY